MFSMGEMLSKRNQRNALEHFKTKKDGRGEDGMRLSELEDYWELNQERIEQELKTGTYQPGLIRYYEIVNGKGKKRQISSMDVIDRFITRLAAQKLKRYLEPEFLPNSFAYQDGKGIQSAVAQAVKYMEDGQRFVVEIDLKDFFDTIPLEGLMLLLEERITDETVVKLIRQYLYCRILVDGAIRNKSRGIVQGNPMSPVFSNLYLHSLDIYMEEKGYCWIRFADDIRVYTESKEQGEAVFQELVVKLSELCLCVNQKKSGIYEACSRSFLGYDFYKKNGRIDVRKHEYRSVHAYHNWHSCAVEKVNHEYHIVKDGVLNRQDYALLFENEQEKHHIPVEALEQINLYGNVTIASSVLGTLSRQRIRLALIGKYGELLGYYVPNGYTQDAKTVLKQSQKYGDSEQRLLMARRMEIAALYNMRANLRYYQKKKKCFEETLAALEEDMKAMREEKVLDNLMLIEARAKQKYYAAFNGILESEGFAFIKRTKRPPQDPLNAMISFGNTLLYNLILQLLWKTSLDPRIGIVHAANKRNHSLNLDFADLFKPLVVDRVIFTLINCKMIKSDEHFREVENGGIYLSEAGKGIFIKKFEEKLSSVLVVRNKSCTYRKLIENELRLYQQYVLKDTKYKPYKYY